jgi:hypothetical protein
VKKLTALLRLVLALLRSSGFTLTHERLPDERVKIRILRAVNRAREFVPLRALLRFMRLSPSRFHASRRLQDACALADQSSCPHTSPHRLTASEVRTIEDMTRTRAVKCRMSVEAALQNVREDSSALPDCRSRRSRRLARHHQALASGSENRRGDRVAFARICFLFWPLSFAKTRSNRNFKKSEGGRIRPYRRGRTRTQRSSLEKFNPDPS